MDQYQLYSGGAEHRLYSGTQPQDRELLTTETKLDPSKISMRNSVGIMCNALEDGLA